MVLPYTRYKNQKTGGYVHRPMLDVIFSIEGRSFSSKGLLDTGSDTTLINKAFGKEIGIDFGKCKRGVSVGISGEPQKTWLSEIELEVENLPNSKRMIEVGFIDSPTVGILLGHKGFFENFCVKFETYCLLVEVDNRP